MPWPLRENCQRFAFWLLLSSIRATIVNIYIYIYIAPSFRCGALNDSSEEPKQYQSKHIFAIVATPNHFSICFCWRVFKFRTEPNQKKRAKEKEESRNEENARWRFSAFIHVIRLTEYKMEKKRSERRRTKRSKNEKDAQRRSKSRRRRLRHLSNSAKNQNGKANRNNGFSFRVHYMFVLISIIRTLYCHQSWCGVCAPRKCLPIVWFFGCSMCREHCCQSLLSSHTQHSPLLHARFVGPTGRFLPDVYSIPGDCVVILLFILFHALYS